MLPPRQASRQDNDSSIRQTDTDAAGARLSAVQKQYLHDPFIKLLVPRAHLQPPRPPLINIGTYVRSEGIDELVDQWLLLSAKEGTKCQIVSLGAGSDTRFWRIETGPQKGRLAAYIELDFSEITTKKAMAIKKNKELSSVLGAPEDVKLAQGGTALHSPIYNLLPVDLRLPPSQTIGNLLSVPESQSLLSPHLPTLLLFECVLVYMAPAASYALMEWFVDYFSPEKRAGSPSSGTEDEPKAGILGAIVYEMFGLGDPFGKVMLNNLKSRGVSLPGVDPYPDFASLPNRFLQHGFTTARALTLRDIRRAYISREELERISKLEMLDEIEELDLVLNHYAITWGVNISPSGATLKAQWAEWGLRQKDGNSTVEAVND